MPEKAGTVATRDRWRGEIVAENACATAAEPPGGRVRVCVRYACTSACAGVLVFGSMASRAQTLFAPDVDPALHTAISAEVATLRDLLKPDSNGWPARTSRLAVKIPLASREGIHGLLRRLPNRSSKRPLRRNF